MKTKLGLFCLLGAMFLAGCGMDNMFSPGVGSMNLMPMGNQTNGEILGALATFNKSEMMTSELAMKKASSYKLRRFAHTMFAQHKMMLQKTNSIAKRMSTTPSAGFLAQRFQRQQQQNLSQLNTLSGSAFDKAYLDDIIKGHEEALAGIDKMMKETTDSTLTKFLAQSRQHVANHLAKAKRMAHV